MVPLAKLGKSAEGAGWGNNAFSSRYIVFEVTQIEIFKDSYSLTPTIQVELKQTKKTCLEGFMSNWGLHEFFFVFLPLHFND